MVRVKGQLDAPLVDIGTVREEYWERKEVKLPSLAKYHKKKSGWFGWRKQTEVPKVVIRKLTQAEWGELDSKFYNLKLEIAKEANVYKKISKKMLNAQKVTDKEAQYVADFSTRCVPLYYGMLSYMIEKPKMNYEDVRLMFDVMDEYDQKTLMAISDSMLNEKAKMMQHVYQERIGEIDAMREDVLAKHA